MSVFAQSFGGGDPFPLVSYGVLGMVVVALLGGWLWARPAVQRLIDDKARVEAQRDELMTALTTRVMPVLASSTAANEALRPVLEEVVRVLRDVYEMQRRPLRRRPNDEQ